MIGSLSISSVTMALDGNKTKEVNKEMSRYKDIVELWKGFGIESSADLESHLENFSILFAYNSGAIENREITYHDTREIFESGKVSGYSGNLKTLFEISNMKDAYRLMLKWFDEKTPLSLESIKEMHYQIAKLTYSTLRTLLSSCIVCSFLAHTLYAQTSLLATESGAKVSKLGAKRN